MPPSANPSESAEMLAAAEDLAALLVDWIQTPDWNLSDCATNLVV